MLTGSSHRWFLSLAAASLLVGCTQPGPLISRHTTIGTLKTSLSHLEFENQQLRSKVSTLESENREIENKLVQEESVNGELSARLDDARNALKLQGDNWGTGGSTATTNRDESPSRALPAGRSNRTPRKPPFARIPGRIDSSTSSEPGSDDFGRPAIPSSDPFGPQSALDDDARWLPIARGAAGAAPTKIR